MSFQGRVVTETTTEYKEVTDDSGGFSDFPQLSSANSAASGQQTLLKAESSAESSSADEDEDSAKKFEKEEKFQKEALKAHNDYRAKHGVEDLKLDKKVSTVFS